MFTVYLTVSRLVVFAGFDQCRYACVAYWKELQVHFLALFWSLNQVSQSPDRLKGPKVDLGMCRNVCFEWISFLAAPRKQNQKLGHHFLMCMTSLYCLIAEIWERGDIAQAWETWAQMIKQVVNKPTMKPDSYRPSSFEGTTKSEHAQNDGNNAWFLCTYCESHVSKVFSQRVYKEIKLLHCFIQCREWHNACSKAC